MFYDNILSLFSKLFFYEDLHLSRIKCLAGFVSSILSQRTVNMAILSCAYPTESTEQSAYMRLRRFLIGVSFKSQSLAKIIAELSDLPIDKQWILSIDRTNWKFGKNHINLLVLSACSELGSAAIPLFWIQLEDKKCGNSDHLDRLDLMDMFCQAFGKEKIFAVVGDREFIGTEWFSWFAINKINYAIRLRENGTYIANSKGKMLLASELLRGLNVNEKQSLGIRKVGKSGEQFHYLTATRNNNGEILLLAHSEQIKQPIEIYKKRWQIEVLFKCCKTNGFDMETTHVTRQERIETLMGVIALAFVIAYKFGIWQSKTKPQKIKKHGYLAMSVFKQGTQIISRIVNNYKQKLYVIDQIYQKLFSNIFTKVSFVW